MNICENGAKRRISGCHGANAMSRTHQELIYSAAAHHCAPSSSNFRSSVDRPIHGNHFGIGVFLLVKISLSSVLLCSWPDNRSVPFLPLWLKPVAPCGQLLLGSCRGRVCASSATVAHPSSPCGPSHLEFIETARVHGCTATICEGCLPAPGIELCC